MKRSQMKVKISYNLVIVFRNKWSTDILARINRSFSPLRVRFVIRPSNWIASNLLLVEYNLKVFIYLESITWKKETCISSFTYFTFFKSLECSFFSSFFFLSKYTRFRNIYRKKSKPFVVFCFERQKKREGNDKLCQNIV